MNNKSVIIGALVVLVAGGIVTAVVMNNKTTTSTTTTGTPQAVTTSTTPTTTSTEQNAATESKSFKEILASGAAVKCAFSDNAQEAVGVKGTVYTNGTMMGSTFQSTVNGTMMNGHMIMRDGYMYSWVDGLPTATKFKLDAVTPQGNTANSSTDKGVDLDKKVNLSCNPWAVDSSVFTVPSDRTFQDFTEMMGGLKVNTTPKIEGSSSVGSSANSAQCTACQNLTGDSKTQCLAAFGCK